MAARRRQNQNRLGRQGRSRLPAARIPPSHAGAPRLAEPQRTLELRHTPGRRPAAGALRREDTRSLSPGVVALGRTAPAGRKRGAVVRTPLHCPGRMAAGSPAAALRRRGLGGRRLSERHPRRRAQRRLHGIFHRHRTLSHTRGADACRAGHRPHGPRNAAPRQTGDRGPDDLVHPRHRNLADGVAGTRTRKPHRIAAHDSRHRHKEPDRRGRDRRRPARRHRRDHAPRQRAHSRRSPCRCRRTAAADAPGNETLDARHPDALRPRNDTPPRRQVRRPGRQLRRDAQKLRGTWQGGLPAPGAQRPGVLPVRSARPGLVARRTLHGPDRRGARVRHHKDQRFRVQHDPQAREGRTRTLVLALRPAGHPRLAGHAQRRPLARMAEQPLFRRHGGEAHSRIGSAVPQRMERDRRSAL